MKTVEDYYDYRESTNQKMAKVRASARDIAPLPDVVDPDRKETCRHSFRLFCETYFPDLFTLKWSDDHIKVISLIESAVIRGDLTAVAMPRGSGKSTLCMVACLWALLYGHRHYLMFIGASEDHAKMMLDNLRGEISSNDLLLEDFPEACYPIRRLEGVTHRAPGQTLNGKPTQIDWTKKQLTLPTVEGAASSGSIVQVAGITGRIRGAQAKRGKETIRPDLVVVDDPQTDESARSPKQCDDRLRTVAGAILGLSGPGRKIAGIMPCTIIAKGDMADQILDRKKHPDWHGVVMRMLRSMPKNLKLWEQYGEIRSNCLVNDKTLDEANDFYLKNRERMDEGAEASWEDRYNDDEVSAIQHAMNILLRDESAFYAEYQNEPPSDVGESSLVVSESDISRKIVGIDRGTVPEWATHLTAFIDVQKDVLFYAVVATMNDFTAHLVEYGTYPDQPTAVVRADKVRRTIAKSHPGSFEAGMDAALRSLVGGLLDRDWLRQDGSPINISRIGIDANWAQSTTIVRSIALDTTFRGLVMPCHGVGIGADRKPMNDYQKKPGERSGWCWRVMTQPLKMIYDTNAWKSFLSQRIHLAVGDKGTLTIHSGKPLKHKMLLSHLTSEKPVTMTSSDRTVTQWRLVSGKENHLFDCVIGSLVMASEQGVVAVGQDPEPKKAKRPRKKAIVRF